MSAEFRSLVELALSAPITNPKLIMSCVDEDRELGDLHDWSNDVDSLVKAFESQGDCLLGLRSDSGVDSAPIGSGFQSIATSFSLPPSAFDRCFLVSWGAFMCIDQGCPEELVIDHTDNEVMTNIYNAWIEQVS